MTTTGIKLLNEVQKLLIAFANEKGISLQDEFGTVEEFKRFVIAFTIRSLTEQSEPETGHDTNDNFPFAK